MFYEEVIIIIRFIRMTLYFHTHSFGNLVTHYFMIHGTLEIVIRLHCKSVGQWFDFD